MSEKPSTDWHMIAWATLEQESLLLHSVIRFTGQICVGTLKWPIYRPAPTAKEINQQQKNRLALFTLFQSRIRDATLWQSTSLDRYRLIMDLTLLLPLLTVWARISKLCLSTLTAEQLAEIFFDKWYCENGLPLDIVSDRDKLFMSRFWKTLHTLTGVKLKMSTSYHPETDGSSERTNKTVIQCIRFAVERNQLGWVKSLPKIRFDIMNTTNRSTGFTPFQLRFGRSPRILPPLFASSSKHPADKIASDLILRMQADISEAKDNLISSKITQAFQANKSRSLSFPFKVGDKVVLSTLHRRRDLKAGDPNRVAKFMPRFDGPYIIKNTDEKHSTVTLDLPTLPNLFPVFHTSEIKHFIENDNSHFPSRALIPREPVTIDGQQEFFIDRIVDERKRRKKTQYRVRWQGEGPEGDEWIAEEEICDCEALDIWNAHKTAAGGNFISYVTSPVPAGSFSPTGF